MIEQHIEIPYTPRPLQQELHNALDSHRFVVAVCHRRFGKTVAIINHLQKGALTCQLDRPRYALVEPTYRQGKAVAWDYMKHYARPIPGIKINEAELRVDYPNGGQVRIYGADDPDSLRGLYFDGVGLDEYGLMMPKLFSEVIRPSISDRMGWCGFFGTPNGRNQFYEAAEQAKVTSDWQFCEYKASQTQIIPQYELDAMRSLMTEDEYMQEMECSFEASVKGAIYAKELLDARESGRITVVPYDPILPVDTDWDLGVGDPTAIWFSQTTRGGEIRLIDYYESEGEGLPHYATVLDKRGYKYGEHWAPHDIQVRELGSGRSRIETAKSLGISFKICPNIPIEDGIHAARMLFPRCWFDDKRTNPGREGLQNYRRDYNIKMGEFKSAPVHDWSSHASDGFRYLAVRHKDKQEKRKAVHINRPVGVGAWMT